MSHPDSVRHVIGLANIASNYDLILCDVWGVLHDGVRGHEAAADALSIFRGNAVMGLRRRVVLISNAPRSQAFVRSHLDSFGVRRDAYDAILTSGDLTRALIVERIATDPDIRVHHLGPDRIAGLFTGLGVDLVAASQANLVVCTALIDDTRDRVEDYLKTLSGLRARGVPMICANPDLVVGRGTRLIPCAGLLAAAYAEMGGVVVFAGKPHRPIYEAAVRTADDFGAAVPIDLSRILAIGDALQTDIAGARNFGIASLLVARGIHADKIARGVRSSGEASIAAWLKRQAVQPDAVIDRLVW